MVGIIDTFFQQHYTLLLVLAGTSLMGMVSGMLGVFTFLQKQSLLGDAISHAALPGIALIFLCTHSKNPITLLAGGAVSGCIGIVLTMIVIRKTTLKIDTM